MNRYKAFVHGTNFYITIEGERQRVGFYTTRVVEAGNPDDARGAVLELIKEALTEREIQFTDANLATQVDIEELEQLDRDRDDPEKIGFSFYIDNDSES